MPPYSKKPSIPPTNHQRKTRTGLRVTFPQCNWCGEIERIFTCRGCGKPTCYSCIIEMEYGKCIHRQFKATSNTGWGTPCSNRNCGPECKECDGRGMIW